MLAPHWRRLTSLDFNHLMHLSHLNHLNHLSHLSHQIKQINQEAVLRPIRVRLKMPGRLMARGGCLQKGAAVTSFSLGKLTAAVSFVGPRRIFCGEPEISAVS